MSTNPTWSLIDYQMVAVTLIYWLYNNKKNNLDFQTHNLRIIYVLSAKQLIFFFIYNKIVTENPVDCYTYEQSSLHMGNTNLRVKGRVLLHVREEIKNPMKLEGKTFRNMRRRISMELKKDICGILK